MVYKLPFAAGLFFLVGFCLQVLDFLLQGFAGVEGTEVLVFFPNVGTSKVQRLQMTTPADKNVHAVAIKGNFRLRLSAEDLESILTEEMSME